MSSEGHWVVGGGDDDGKDAVERDKSVNRWTTSGAPDATESRSPAESKDGPHQEDSEFGSQWIVGRRPDAGPDEKPADGKGAEEQRWVSGAQPEERPPMEPTDGGRREGGWSKNAWSTAPKFEPGIDVRVALSTGESEGESSWEVGVAPRKRGRSRALEILKTLVRQGAGLEATVRRAVETLRDGLAIEYAEFLELSPAGKLVFREGIGWESGGVGTASLESDTSSYAGYALARARERVVVANADDERRFGTSQLAEDHGIVSSLIGAVRSGDRTLGVLAAHSVTPHNFGREDVHFFDEVVNVLSVGIERACEKQVAARFGGGAPDPRASADQRYEFLADAIEIISAAADKASVLRGLARLAVPALADWCFVDLLAKSGTGETIIERLGVQRTHTSRDTEGPGQELTYRCPAYLDAPHGTMKVIRTGELEIGWSLDEGVRRALTNDDVQLRLMRYLGSGSYICVPLRAAGRTLGALLLINFSLGTELYGEQDLVLTKLIAAHATLAIQAASLGTRAYGSGGSALSADFLSELDGISAGAHPPKLTPRQSQVLRLLADGLANKEIAKKLGDRAVGTAETHVRAVLAAFDSHSRHEAVLKARQLGMISS